MLNQGHKYREQLGSCVEGQTLLDFLEQRYTHSTRDAWSERIAEGAVLLDGRPAVGSALLHAGQWLSWTRPGWVEPSAPLGFAVLFEDADLLAVAKPAGLPTLPGAGFLEHTLLHCVRSYDPRAAPLHRLGRHASGVVLCARNAVATTSMMRVWNDGTVVKLYRALASGDPANDSFEITVPIGPVPYAPLGTLHAARDDGKSAHSIVTVLERRGDRFLCDVQILSGRPHQIRIHLAAAGHPLVGDPLYVHGGIPNPVGDAVPGDGGYLLHARELSFGHPRSGERVTVRCAPPPNLRNER